MRCYIITKSMLMKYVGDKICPEKDFGDRFLSQALSNFQRQWRPTWRVPTSTRWHQHYCNYHLYLILSKSSFKVIFIYAILLVTVSYSNCFRTSLDSRLPTTTDSLVLTKEKIESVPSLTRFQPFTSVNFLITSDLEFF